MSKPNAWSLKQQRIRFSSVTCSMSFGKQFFMEQQKDNHSDINKPKDSINFGHKKSIIPFTPAKIFLVKAGFT